MNKAKMLLITLCLVSLVASLGACGYKSQVKEEVAEYLETMANTRLVQLQQDYQEYDQIASRKEAYHLQAMNTQAKCETETARCKALTTVEIVRIGSWGSGGTMSVVHHAPPEDQARRDRVCNSVTVKEQQYQWSKLCEQKASILSRQILELEALCRIWRTAPSQ